MKQMVYENILLRERFVLESGQYMGYNFWIISYGTHPCAYVELPQTHPYFGKCNSDAYELNIDVHGGITYGDFGLGNIVDDKKFLLGWDYNHCTDYNPMTNTLFVEPLKRWTTEEILEEVKDVIKQLHIVDVSKKVGEK